MTLLWYRTEKLLEKHHWVRFTFCMKAQKRGSNSTKSVEECYMMESKSDQWIYDYIICFLGESRKEGKAHIKHTSKLFMGLVSLLWLRPKIAEAFPLLLFCVTRCSKSISCKTWYGGRMKAFRQMFQICDICIHTFISTKVKPDPTRSGISLPDPIPGVFLQSLLDVGR